MTSAITAVAVSNLKKVGYRVMRWRARCRNGRYSYFWAQTLKRAPSPKRRTYYCCIGMYASKTYGIKNLHTWYAAICWLRNGNESLRYCDGIVLWNQVHKYHTYRIFFYHGRPSSVHAFTARKSLPLHTYHGRAGGPNYGFVLYDMYNRY